MGYRCRWIATRARTRTREDVLAELNFSVTGEIKEEIYDTGLYAVTIGDWCVVFADGWDFMDLLQADHARRLSSRGEVLFFYADDSAMCAELTAYAGGNLTWSLSYNGTEGITEPKLTGDVPAETQSVLAAAREQQAAEGRGEDAADCMYDAAPELGRTLVGFRHDKTLTDGEFLPVLQLSPR